MAVRITSQEATPRAIARYGSTAYKKHTYSIQKLIINS